MVPRVLGPMGAHGEPIGAHGCPWVPMGAHGEPIGSPLGAHGCPWDVHWAPMGARGAPMGRPWVPLGAPGAPIGRPWALHAGHGPWSKLYNQTPDQPQSGRYWYWAARAVDREFIYTYTEHPTFWSLARWGQSRGRGGLPRSVGTFCRPGKPILRLLFFRPKCDSWTGGYSGRRRLLLSGRGLL